MIGVLIGAGLIFYAVLYSGVQTLAGNPISTLDALLGREKTPERTTGPRSTGPRKAQGPTGHTRRV